MSTKEPVSMLMAHWLPLLNMISLVEPPHLRKALQEWVNKNQNCAYTMKTGACQMDCDKCLNDITIERIVAMNKASKDIQQRTKRGV